MSPKGLGICVTTVLAVWACTRTAPDTARAPAEPVATPAASGEVDPRPRDVRAPSSAGSFYPADPSELASVVQRDLDAAERVSKLPVRIVLAPHAGIRFSGGIAARSFKQLDPGFRRVVILAANHNDEADWDGVSVDQVTDYAMPGFEVHVAPLVTELVKRPGFVVEPRAHVMHMIEMELPFLRATLGNGFQIVPLIVGRLDAEGSRRVARELEKLAEPKTLFVFSIDLSHYHPYDEARSLDTKCLAALTSTEANAVEECDTDGTRVLAIMNQLAAELALTPRLVAYENSGDVTGDKTKVVGYGSLVYEDRFELSNTEGKELLRLARGALAFGVTHGKAPKVPGELSRRWPRLGAERGAFVTLEKKGELRGCIGSLSASEPLADDVAKNAVSAALEDSRFSPVKPAELSEIQLSVSVLDIPRPLAPLAPDALLAKLSKDKPGVILEFQGRRSTFLPQVWKDLPEARGFLEALCEKQGSPKSCWQSKDARYQTYAVQLFEESGATK